MTQIITRISEEFKPGNPHMAHTEIRMIKEGFKACTNPCKDKDWPFCRTKTA
jgi:hypothetical protein